MQLTFARTVIELPYFFFILPTHIQASSRKTNANS